MNRDEFVEKAVEKIFNAGSNASDVVQASGLERKTFGIFKFIFIIALAFLGAMIAPDYIQAEYAGLIGGVFGLILGILFARLAFWILKIGLVLAIIFAIIYLINYASK